MKTEAHWRQLLGGKAAKTILGNKALWHTLDILNTYIIRFYIRWMTFLNNMLYFVYFLILHSHQSFPLPPLFQVPLFIFSHPSSIVSFQKQAGIQWISASCGLPSCNEMRHPFLYQGWMRKSSRKNRSQKLATELGAAPALTVRSFIKRLNCIALAYMRRA